MASSAKRHIVIVNDCAHVMEDLIPYLSKSYHIDFIQRSRARYSKTLGILVDILKARGDIFHVNYALQDAFMVDTLKGKLDLLHVHGSDVRTTMNSPLGWMVKRDLKHAKKVIYATPDLEIPVRKYRDDADYLPTPIDTFKFAPKDKYNQVPKALYFILKYERLPERLEDLLRSNGIELHILNRNIPYRDMPSLLRNFDIFIDRFTIDSFSKTCLESMSVGLATIDYRHKLNLEERVGVLSETGNVEREGRSNRLYAISNHEVGKVSKILSGFYEDLLN